MWTPNVRNKIDPLAWHALPPKNVYYPNTYHVGKHDSK